MTTDDPRMAEFDRLLDKVSWHSRQDVRDGKGRNPSRQTDAARTELRTWVAAQLAPPPAGERAELVRECRERSAWFDTCRESAGYPRPASGDTAALLTRAADALEAEERALRICGWCGKELDRRAARGPKIPADEFFQQYNAGIESERRLDPEGGTAQPGAESAPVVTSGDDLRLGDPGRAAPSLASRVDQLAGRLDGAIGTLAARIDALEARETPTGDPRPAERVTGDPQNDGHGHSHEHT